MTGKFIDIPASARVRNTSGNCAWCATETVALTMGLTQLKGMAIGKGGAGPSNIGGYLRSQGVEFKQMQGPGSWKLAKEFLDQGKPVLFSIPGHALLCCGYSTDLQGKEWIWVIDNTGPEGLKPKGWPKAQWDARHDGWVLGLTGQCSPTPNAGPRRPPKIDIHIDPSPSTVPMPVVPVAPIAPVVQPLSPQTDAAIKKMNDEFKALKDAIANQKPQADMSKPLADLTAMLQGVQDQIKTIKLMPGKPGKDGLPGKDGVDGKDGAPGKDGKDADTSSLLAQMAQLQAQITALQATVNSIPGAVRVRIEPAP